MLRLIKITLLLFTTILITGPLLILVATSDDQAIAHNNTQVNTQTAARLKGILYRLEYASYFGRRQTLPITEADINGALALANRAVKRIDGVAQISAQQGTTLSLSLHVPENPFGAFINIRLHLPPQSKGVTMGQIDIGRLSFHGSTAQFIMEQALARLVGKPQSDEMLNAINGYSSRDQMLLVNYQPVPNLGRLLARSLNNSGLLGGDATSLAEPATVQHYYQQLCSQYHDGNDNNLASYLAPLFFSAAQRSQDDQEAVAENRAVLTALAIFFGSYKFNTLLNAVPGKVIDSCQKTPPQSLLAGRQDLSLHFIYSAMIKILSDRGISFTMGEFKELSDTLRGGSGFSFIDLAADQAGIRFAELATHPDSARRLQQQSAKLKGEQYFFPALRDLPENISQQRFEQEYGGLDSERYQQLLADINSRIERLPLYTQ